jgi:opacity protein-like surface antigen
MCRASFDGAAARKSANGFRDFLGDLMMTIRNKLLIGAVAAAALATTTAFADSDVLKAGDASTMSQWHGRAGGLVGAERIAALRSNHGNPGIEITYDRAIAERTNMPVDRPAANSVGVTYDREVAARTNMARTQDAGQVRAAGTQAPKAN